MNNAAAKPRRSVAVALPGLFLIALFFFINEAASLLTPIVIACLLSLLLSPLVRGAGRLGVPPAISALVLLGSLVAGLVSGINYLAEPAEKWLQDVPNTLREIRGQMNGMSGPLGDIQRVTQEVDTLTDSIADNNNGEAPVAVEVESDDLMHGLLGGAVGLLASFSVVIFLSFFLLAGGEDLLRKMTILGRNYSERRRIVSAVRQIQHDVSVHLGTVTLINAALGCSVGLTMWALGVPNPVLWGVMAGLFNFAPYLGSVVSAAVLTLVGMATFPEINEALMVPACFFAITILEGQMITPAILGQRLSLSPTVVFLSVVVWGWLWGIAGALIAVPVTAAIKVALDHVPSCQIWAQSMDRANPPRQRSMAASVDPLVG